MGDVPIIERQAVCPCVRDRSGKPGMSAAKMRT